MFAIAQWNRDISCHSPHFCFMGKEAPDFSVKNQATLVYLPQMTGCRDTYPYHRQFTFSHGRPSLEVKKVLESTHYSSRCLFTPYGNPPLLSPPSLLSTQLVIRIEKSRAQSLS